MHITSIQKSANLQQTHVYKQFLPNLTISITPKELYLYRDRWVLLPIDRLNLKALLYLLATTTASELITNVDQQDSMHKFH